MKGGKGKIKRPYFEATPVDRLHWDGFGMDDSHVLSGALEC